MIKLQGVERFAGVDQADDCALPCGEGLLGGNRQGFQRDNGIYVGGLLGRAVHAQAAD